MARRKKKATQNKKATRKKGTRGGRQSAGAESSGSAKYPRHPVRKALRIPQAILDQNAGKACTVGQAAAFLGVGNSGPFRVEVSSAIKYGFLERTNSSVRPTDRAKQILRPQSESDDIQGLRDAIMEAPQIADVYRHYRGENLPDTQFFKNTVVDTYRVPNDKFPEFHEVFSESLKEARLLDEHGGKARVLDVTEDASTPTERTDTMRKLGRGVTVDSSATCFVMQPFSAPLGDYYEKIYKPAIEKAGLTSIRADADIFGAGKIMDQVWRGITDAEVLIAELTSRNANVFYELGLAHAMQKPVVLISSNEGDVPFDLQHIRVIYYDVNDPFWGNKLLDKIAENILSALRNPEEAIFRGGQV